MFPNNKIIEIFSICDDFSKVFDKTLEQKAIPNCDSSKKRKYHRDGMMSDSEVMTILILFHDSGYRCLKHFYIQYVCKYMRHLFPKNSVLQSIRGTGKTRRSETCRPCKTGTYGQMHWYKFYR